MCIYPKTMNLNFTGYLSKCKCIRMGTVRVRFELSVKILSCNLLVSEVTDIEVQEVGGKYCIVTVSELIISVINTFSMTDL
jgi:hypothetical protein